jgi:hypothetical protein
MQGDTAHFDAGMVALCASTATVASSDAADSREDAGAGAAAVDAPAVSKAYRPQVRSEDPSDKFARLMGLTGDSLRERPSDASGGNFSNSEGPSSPPSSALHVHLLDLRHLAKSRPIEASDTVRLVTAAAAPAAEVPLCICGVSRGAPTATAAHGLEASGKVTHEQSGLQTTAASWESVGPSLQASRSLRSGGLGDLQQCTGDADFAAWPSGSGTTNDGHKMHDIVVVVTSHGRLLFWDSPDAQV